MVYLPGSLSQTWGYRIALMGEMQDQPLGDLSCEKYASLEFAEEIPTRNTAQRLEYQEEQRNTGAVRRIYRPLMCVGDLLQFLASDVARRGCGATSRMQAALGGATGEEVKPEPLAMRENGDPRECKDERKLGLLACQERRERLADLSRNFDALPLTNKRRRLLLKHETELAFTEALADAHLCLLQRLYAQDAF